MPVEADDDARYRALRSRDARFDGVFFTGVTSTGIYCRPICPTRTPKRDKTGTITSDTTAVPHPPALSAYENIFPGTNKH